MNTVILEQLNNLTNKEQIVENMKFYAMYLLIFERFKNRFVDELKYFLCDVSITNGKLEFKETIEYKKIKNIKHNGKVNIFINTIEWFKNNKAISKDDYDLILSARDDRNLIGHELLELLSHPVKEKMLHNFIVFINIFKKMAIWWINNIEIPTASEGIPLNYNPDDVIPGDLLLCDILMDTIYGEGIYKQGIEKINQNLNEN